MVAALKYFIRIYFRILKTYPNFKKKIINAYLKIDQESNLRSHKQTNTQKSNPGRDNIFSGYFISGSRTFYEQYPEDGSLPFLCTVVHMTRVVGKKILMTGFADGWLTDLRS